MVARAKVLSLPSARAILVTCEHGGNRVPAPYAAYFKGWERRLSTHRGWDLGALTMARALARAFDAPLVASQVTRLLVDLNRSLGHPDLLSSASRKAPPAERLRVVKHHYTPYRDRVRELVDAAFHHEICIVHVSSHSFTPKLHGEVRRADIGLLYDPRRSHEKTFCAHWKKALSKLAPHLVVRRNYPYRGKNDGLTATLRKRYPPDAYVGIEIELNQALVVGDPRVWAAARRIVVDSLRTTLGADGIAYMGAWPGSTIDLRPRRVSAPTTGLTSGCTS